MKKHTPRGVLALSGRVSHARRVTQRKCSIVLLQVVLASLCLHASTAFGAIYDVDRTDDDATATACTSAPNDCSLRGAIIAANANPGPDTINLPARTY